MFWRRLGVAWFSYSLGVLLLIILTMLCILLYPIVFLILGVVTFTYGVIVLISVDFLAKKWNLSRVIKISIYSFFGIAPGYCNALWQYYETNYLMANSFRDFLFYEDYLMMGVGFFMALVAGIVDDLLQKKPHLLKDWRVLAIGCIPSLILVPIFVFIFAFMLASAFYH